jgi:hypothetical protein
LRRRHPPPTTIFERVSSFPAGLRDWRFEARQLDRAGDDLIADDETRRAGDVEGVGEYDDDTSKPN